MALDFLHAMVRVRNLEESIKFFCDIFGLEEQRRKDCPQWDCTLVYLIAPGTPDFQVELTYNYGDNEYDNGSNFGHLAFGVDNIYETCQKLLDHGITINRPPRDGWMAFFKTPDGISIELLQKGERLEPAEPWASMENTGSW